MRIVPVILLAGLCACVEQDMGSLEHKARFAAYPDELFEALESSCTEPADTFLRSGRDTVECRSYLSPDATAAIIFRYDGTLEDLPQLVMRFRAAADQPGYLVDFDAFLNVPQKQGEPLRVIHKSPALTNKINAMMRHAGGEPLQGI